MMLGSAKLSRFPVTKSKQDPQVLFIHSQAAAATSIVAAIEAVVMVVVMVMMVVVIPPISRDHHDRLVVVVIATTIEATAPASFIDGEFSLSPACSFSGRVFATPYEHE